MPLDTQGFIDWLSDATARERAMWAAGGVAAPTGGVESVSYAAMDLVSEWRAADVQGNLPSEVQTAYRLLRSSYESNARGRQFLAFIDDEACVDGPIDTLSPLALRARLFRAMDSDDEVEALQVVGALRARPDGHDAGEVDYLEALCHLRSGRPEAAVAAAGRLAATDPDYGRAQYVLARALALLGDEHGVDRILRASPGAAASPSLVDLCSFALAERGGVSPDLENPPRFRDAVEARPWVDEFAVEAARFIVPRLTEWVDRYEQAALWLGEVSDEGDGEGWVVLRGPRWCDWIGEAAERDSRFGALTAALDQVRIYPDEFGDSESPANAAGVGDVVPASLLDLLEGGVRARIGALRFAGAVLLARCGRIPDDLELAWFAGMAGAGDPEFLIGLYDRDPARFRKAPRWLPNLYRALLDVGRAEDAARVRLLTEEHSRESLRSEAFSLPAGLQGDARLLLESALVNLRGHREASRAWQDAGYLSLQFFSALEAHINQRLVRPALMREESRGLDVSALSKRDVDRWKQILGGIAKVQSGEKTGLPLGALRILLSRLADPGHGSDAALRVQLRAAFVSQLTSSGLVALDSGRFVALIDEDTVGEFRNPPAHGTPLPLSTAERAWGHVDGAITAITEWTIPDSKEGAARS